MPIPDALITTIKIRGLTGTADPLERHIAVGISESVLKKVLEKHIQEPLPEGYDLVLVLDDRKKK